jgi:hypothetical protein
MRIKSKPPLSRAPSTTPPPKRRISLGVRQGTRKDRVCSPGPDAATWYCQIKPPCSAGGLDVARVGHGFVLSLPSLLPPAQQSGTPKATQIPVNLTVPHRQIAARLGPRSLRHATRRAVEGASEGWPRARSPLMGGNAQPSRGNAPPATGRCVACAPNLGYERSWYGLRLTRRL